jgi:hypothetical protein
MQIIVSENIFTFRQKVYQSIFYFVNEIMSIEFKKLNIRNENTTEI